MCWRKRARLLVTISFVLLLAPSIASRPRKMQRLSAGSWGGNDIRLEVGPRCPTIEYVCANATINGPFTINNRGRFIWRGVHNQEHGGPIRLNERRNSRAAIYSGWIKGDTMSLTVKFA